MTNAGKSPCHCHHHDTLKDRVDAAEARLAEADKFCELPKARVDVLHEAREKFLKDGVFNTDGLNRGDGHDGRRGGDGPGGGGRGGWFQGPRGGYGAAGDKAVTYMSRPFEEKTAEDVQFQ